MRILSVLKKITSTKRIKNRQIIFKKNSERKVSKPLKENYSAETSLISIKLFLAVELCFVSKWLLKNNKLEQIY